MPSTVSDHYAKHLGPVYLWMVGGFEAAVARSAAELEALPVPTGGTAVDLGAGFGSHALPLARRGYSVLAIDSSELLLGELEVRKGALPVRVVHADLVDFREHLAARADLIVCMGDTLTHLQDRERVASLLEDVAEALAPGGVFVATFRNYASAPLQADARFIPVRNDAERIFTCFLEYAADTVTVHDLLHTRVNGAWQFSVSSYSKLRLDPQWVAARLSSSGLAVTRETAGGLVRIVAARATAS